MAINILSLDGGGVRGYLCIRLLLHVMENQHCSQLAFSSRFHYICGTSTGGLIAFAVACNYPLSALERLYRQLEGFFIPHPGNRKTFGWPLFHSRFSPDAIHRKIEEVVAEVTASLNAEMDRMHGAGGHLPDYITELTLGHVDIMLKRRSPPLCLVITAFNATENRVIIYDSSHPAFRSFRVVDVLKATMAAPTFFPPHYLQQALRLWRRRADGCYVDGGIFANDPELAGLWAARLNPASELVDRFNIVSIGTGVFEQSLGDNMQGGYKDWIFNNGLLINTILEANRSFTEVIAAGLGRTDNIRRFKCNFMMSTAMDLSSSQFPRDFEDNFARLRASTDVRALISIWQQLPLPPDEGDRELDGIPLRLIPVAFHWWYGYDPPGIRLWRRNLNPARLADLRFTEHYLDGTRNDFVAVQGRFQLINRFGQFTGLLLQRTNLPALRALVPFIDCTPWAWFTHDDHLRAESWHFLGQVIFN